MFPFVLTEHRRQKRSLIILPLKRTTSKHRAYGRAVPLSSAAASGCVAGVAGPVKSQRAMAKERIFVVKHIISTNLTSSKLSCSNSFQAANKGPLAKLRMS
jgi:hypothetical protein